MAKGYTVTQDIPATPEQVFGVLTDLEQAREWMPAIQKVQRLPQDATGPVAKGSKWIETRMTPRGPFVSTLTVTECEAPKRFAIKAENKQAVLAFEFDLVANDAGGTTVTGQGSGKLKGLRSLFSGALVKQMQKEDADLMARLQAQVAKGRPAPQPTPSEVSPAAKPAKGAKAAKAGKAPAPKGSAKPAAKAAAKPGKAAAKAGAKPAAKKAGKKAK